MEAVPLPPASAVELAVSVAAVDDEAEVEAIGEGVRLAVGESAAVVAADAMPPPGRTLASSVLELEGEKESEEPVEEDEGVLVEVEETVPVEEGEGVLVCVLVCEGVCVSESVVRRVALRVALRVTLCVAVQHPAFEEALVKK